MFLLIIIPTYSSFSQVLCANVHYSAANGLCRVEAQCMILISLPRIKLTLCIYCPLVYCTRDSYIDKLTVEYYRQINQKLKSWTKMIKTKVVKWVRQKYQRSTPSLTRSNTALVSGSIGRYFFRKGSSSRYLLMWLT